MGITHYWTRPTELSKTGFQLSAIDVRKILDTMPNQIAGFDGSGTPIINEDRIVFNGASPQSCEPFEVAAIEFDRRGRKEVMSYCKTEGLPYDFIVKAALIILEHHLRPDFFVTSDQSSSNWTKARETVLANLGYGEDFVLNPG